MQEATQIKAIYLSPVLPIQGLWVTDLETYREWLARAALPSKFCQSELATVETGRTSFVVFRTWGKKKMQGFLFKTLKVSGQW